MDEVTYAVNLIRTNWPSTSVMQNTLGIATAHRVKPTVIIPEVKPRPNYSKPISIPLSRPNNSYKPSNNNSYKPSNNYSRPSYNSNSRPSYNSNTTSKPTNNSNNSKRIN